MRLIDNMYIRVMILAVFLVLNVYLWPNVNGYLRIWLAGTFILLAVSTFARDIGDGV